MARLIDFFWDRTSAPTTPIPSAPPSVPAPATTAPRKVTPEELINDDRWQFAPSSVTNTTRYYTDDTVHNATLIYIARSLGRLADDVEAIRKHMTRLQLVTPPTPPEDAPR